MTSTAKSFFQRCRFFGIGGALILTIWLTTAIASGQQTQVDMSAEANSTWCGTPHQLVNCSTYPTGSQTWDGVGFQIPTPNNGWFSDTAASGGNGKVSVTIPVNVSGVVTAYTLMATEWGSTSTGLLNITFTATDGSSFSYALRGNRDIRDQALGYTKSIDCALPNGTGTKGTVSAWKNGLGEVLDMQIFELPASFSSKTLASVTITDNGGLDVQRSFIAALTVSTSAP